MPKPKININRPCYAMASVNGKEAEITMYGEVVDSQPYDSWTGEPIPGSYIIKDDFINDLQSVSDCDTLTLRMDSVGGDASVGLFIHNKLRDLANAGKKLKCVVDGVAMSAGSVIMAACDEVIVHSTSLIMIHKAWQFMFGGYNADELRNIAASLDSWDMAMVKAYERKTGLSETVISHMMSDTTYMTGDEALEKHFADTLSEEDGAAIAASADRSAFIVNGKRYALGNGAKVPESIPTVAAPAAEPAEDDTNNKPIASGENGGTISMANNLEEFKKENPALLSQLESEIRATLTAEHETNASAAAEAERTRMKEIDAIAGACDPKLVQEAKYDKPCSAQELAYNAMLAEAQKGNQFLQNLSDDAHSSGTENVPSAAEPMNEHDSSKTPQAKQAEADAFIHGLLHKEKEDK